MAKDDRPERVFAARRTGTAVYVGDWRGEVYALDASHAGRRRWTLPDRVAAVEGGLRRLTAGVCSSGRTTINVYALSARSGTLLWRAGTQTAPREPRHASTRRRRSPYGRVYIGCDRREGVLVRRARAASCVWSHGHGRRTCTARRPIWNAAACSPAPTAGASYALDAATGDERWRFKANGPISGSAT